MILRLIWCLRYLILAESELERCREFATLDLIYNYAPVREFARRRRSSALK